MAKLTFKGSYSSGSTIPQATSIVYGANLKKSSSKDSKKPVAKKKALTRESPTNGN
jgi:hypothetical protein